MAQLITAWRRHRRGGAVVLGEGRWVHGEGLRSVQRPLTELGAVSKKFVRFSLSLPFFFEEGERGNRSFSCLVNYMILLHQGNKQVF